MVKTSTIATSPEERIINGLNQDHLACLREFVRAHGDSWAVSGKTFTFGTYPSPEERDPRHGHKEAFLPLINRGIYSEARVAGEGTGIVMLTELGKLVVRKLGLDKELVATE